MIRGYAIGMGAGTQFFTQAGWLVAVGPLTVSSRTGTMAVAWLINVAVAEWVIRRRSVPGRFGAGRRGNAIPVAEGRRRG